MRHHNGDSPTSQTDSYVCATYAPIMGEIPLILPMPKPVCVKKQISLPPRGTAPCSIAQTQDLALRLRLRCSIGDLPVFAIATAAKLDAASRLDPVIRVPIELAIWT